MLETGSILAGYRVERVLGRGGMGVVYEATQLSLNRTVALKVLAAHLGDDETFKERFRREGLIQAAIDHPHIVTVHEAGETEQGLFLAMQVVRGRTLSDLIAARELDPDRTMRVLGPVAEALDVAHGAGLIHRDIKPHNILVGARDHAYLADFGLTKAAEATGLTETGMLVGTYDYLSPEQIRGGRASPLSDVYALTAVLYECLTGDAPYAAESASAVLYAHLEKPPPRVTDRLPELPAELDGVIAMGMAKDPAARPSSAGELLRDAGRAVGSERAGAGLPDRAGAATEAGGPAAAAPPSEAVAAPPAGLGEALGRLAARPALAVPALAAAAIAAGLVLGSAGGKPERQPAGRTGALEPSPRYAESVNGAVARLKAARASAARRLRRAKTPKGQASAAARIAALYATAARTVERAQPSAEARQASSAIAAALRRTGDAYERLASAARRDNRSSYSMAREAARRGEAAVGRALERLERLGYEVG